MASVETRGRSIPKIPMILGIVGGALLGVGSFMNWATVSVNFDAITAAIGVVPPAEVRAQGNASVTGWDVGQGKWMFVTGVVVVIAAVLLVFASSAEALALIVIFGGAVGGSMAVYEATAGKNHRLDDIAGLFALTLPGNLRQYFSVSVGIGIRSCALGGFLAVVAGGLAIARRTPSVADPSGSS